MTRRRDSSSVARPLGSDPRVVDLLEQLVAAVRKLQTAPDPDALLGPTDVARLLDVNPRTFRQLRHAGQAPPSVTIGAVEKWRRCDIDAWLAEKARE